MVNPDGIKLQLVREIIQLPDELLPQVRDFLAELANGKRVAVNGAPHEQAEPASESQAPAMSWEQDPILKLIGLADSDPPIKSIDEELYGAFTADHNPLLDYIGGVSHGSLSNNIDKELYGE